jgi:VIT1/CCC1 family predicted Fe2+/Mn2+ transporter
MAVSNFLGTKAEEQLRDRMRKVERDHISRYPAGEREEIRQIFAAKGFEGQDLERAVKTITSDVDRWVDTMLTDELGVALKGPNAWRAAWSTFIAFIVIGSLPLLVFIYEVAFAVAVPSAFLYSSLLTGVAFFTIGAIKSRFIGHKWWTSGLETLAVGAIAAAMAYLVGVMLRGLGAAGG